MIYSSLQRHITHAQHSLLAREKGSMFFVLKGDDCDENDSELGCGER